MFSDVTQVLLFLTNTFFGFYIFCLLLRLLLQWFDMNYHNQLAQFTSKITNPVVLPLRSVLPRIGKFDLAGWVVAYLLTLIKLLIIFVLHTHGIPNPVGLVIWGIPNLLGQVFDLFFFAVIIVIILSWVMPGARQHPILEAVFKLTDPLLSRAQRLIPPVAGFDLSPMLVLILLKVIPMLLLSPLLRIVQTIV